MSFEYFLFELVRKRAKRKNNLENKIVIVGRTCWNENRNSVASHEYSVIAEKF